MEVDLQDMLEARVFWMTSGTERCIGLVRSWEVAECACLIGLYVVSIPRSVWVVSLVERGMNQMD